MPGRVFQSANKSARRLYVGGARYHESVRPRAWSRSGEGKTTDENTGNTVDVDDGSVEHRDNPLEGIELARTTNAVKSAATEPATAPAADHPKRRRFERYTTEDGEIFFVDVDTEESVWDLPSDGEEVEAPC